MINDLFILFIIISIIIIIIVIIKVIKTMKKCQMKVYLGNGDIIDVNIYHKLNYMLNMKLADYYEILE